MLLSEVSIVVHTQIVHICLYICVNTLLILLWFCFRADNFKGVKYYMVIISLADVELVCVCLCEIKSAREDRSFWNPHTPPLIFKTW